ncbi:coiled-coil domain-containing protein 34 isoform X2 [Cynoglossus semilaevis]|uniref:Coiled-coil domain containing 34 n=1 Tax=Cynoglossus semilaevis TaxID=244447 RepID=A0A3P8WBZ4_CYNSE|nr:coiled-coil domain-containing protein 34 isoform X2 [Cynoglossus semilaevis]
MSVDRMPVCPALASEGFSSTPIKSSQKKDLRRLSEDGVVSEDEDTFSLLSPIYHDSYESSEEEELKLNHDEPTSPRLSDNSKLNVSSVRCELPKAPSEQMYSEAVQPFALLPLSPWEEWLVNKSKEHRNNMEKKAEQELLQIEKKKQQERERKQKQIIMEEKIQEWLNMKREMEKRDLQEKQEKEEEKQKQLRKQKEIKQKSQQKYKDWLQKKNQEKAEREKKEKEIVALKEEQEKERCRLAEESFKEWLEKANEKSKSVPKSPSCSTSPYDKFYPSPSFYNPIPWKPVYVPPQDLSPKNFPGSKAQKQRKKL